MLFFSVFYFLFTQFQKEDVEGNCLVLDPICRLLVAFCFNEKQRMSDENIVCGEAKEICLVIPCCPSSTEWDWVKYAPPILVFHCRR